MDKYSSGFTSDKFDPVYTKKQAFSSAFTLWDCVRLARESKKKIYTAGIDVGCEHLYNGRKFKDAYLSLKQKAKAFEKQLKKADKGVSYFKKLEVLLNLDLAIYEVHYHYIIATSVEVKTNDFNNYFEPIRQDKFATYSYFTKEWISVESKSFVTKKNLEGKLPWSHLPLGKSVFGIVKDFIAKSYDALRKQSVYKYYGEFQEINKAKGDKQKEARSDYVLEIINLGDAEMLPMEKMGEYRKFKQLEYMRKQREKKKKIEQIKKLTTGKDIDDVEIVIAPPTKIKPKGKEKDLEMEIIRETKEQKKKRKEAEKMARKKARESEFTYQLKLFRSDEEIEREEWKKAKETKAEEWLSAMEDFFDVSEEEVLELRNERIARLQEIKDATMKLMLRSEKEYITGTKIKAITAIVLNWIGISRLNQNMLLYGFNFALEITKTRYTFSIRLSRTQDRNYWRSGKEKEKEVNRPPPIAKSSRFVDKNGTFLIVKKFFKQKNCIFSLFVVELKCKKFLFL